MKKDKEDVCKNCAYAVIRTDAEKFKWCEYECTYYPRDSEDASRIPYRYANGTCENFLKTERPKD